MTKQEKIRHDIYNILRAACVDCAQDEGRGIDFDEYAKDLTDIVLEYEKAQGVVIKGGSNPNYWADGEMFEAEPLIEVKDV